jgi:hypothetical protein
MGKVYSLCLLVLAVFLFTVATVLGAGQELLVQVQSTQLRASPSFTGRPVAALSYGQKVTVREERDPWFQVTTPAGQGWLHKSAVSENRLALISGSKDAQAKVDNRTVSMAGKGFDQQTEQAWRQGNPKGYAEVDKMLRFTYKPEDNEAFLAAGRVR